MVKIFSDEFNKLLKLVASNDPFCFTRFSDGEITILRNKTVVLGEGYFIQGDLHGDQKNLVHPHSYNEEERKEFYPQKHQFFHKKLVEAFKFKKKNYLREKSFFIFSQFNCSKINKPLSIYVTYLLNIGC